MDHISISYETDRKQNETEECTYNTTNSEFFHLSEAASKHVTLDALRQWMIMFCEIVFIDCDVTTFGFYTIIIGS